MRVTPIACHTLSTPRDLVTDGLRLAYRQAGDPQGTPVLLLHGLMDQSAAFDCLAERWLSNTADSQGAWHLIAPDWRGHGHSQWTPGQYVFANYLADLDDLLETLAPNGPAVLIGHSMGGQAASLYAGIRPERVSRLVLLDSLNVPDSSAEDSGTRYGDWLAARRCPPSVRRYSDLDALCARVAKRYPELDDSDCQALAEIWSYIDDNGQRRLYVDPMHFKPSPYGFRAAEAMAIWQAVQAPVLMLDGALSPTPRFVDDESMAARRACFTRRRRVCLPEVGHMLHWQTPDKIAEHIYDFLADLPVTAD